MPFIPGMQAGAASYRACLSFCPSVCPAMGCGVKGGARSGLGKSHSRFLQGSLSFWPGFRLLAEQGAVGGTKARETWLGTGPVSLFWKVPSRQGVSGGMKRGLGLGGAPGQHQGLFLPGLAHPCLLLVPCLGLQGCMCWGVRGGQPAGPRWLLGSQGGWGEQTHLQSYCWAGGL